MQVVSGNTYRCGNRQNTGELSIESMPVFPQFLSRSLFAFVASFINGIQQFQQLFHLFQHYLDILIRENNVLIGLKLTESIC